MFRPTLRLTCRMLLLLGLTGMRAWAVDIPVFAGAASFNQVSWHPERPGRELAWDEKYLLSVGIDSLRVYNFGLDMEIRAEECLDGLRPTLRTFSLSWSSGPHRVSTGTQAIGLGKDYRFAQSFVSYYAYDSYLFEPARFNALTYTYHKDMLSLETSLGGNQISRGMASAGITLKPYGQEIRTGIRASVSDSHWHSPSLITNLGWDLNLEEFSHSTDLMWKHVQAYNDRLERNETALATEFRYQILPSAGFSVGGILEEREYAPRRKSEFHAAFHQRFGKLSISPGYSSIHMAADHEDSLTALIGWDLYRDFRLGFYYLYGFGLAGGTHHDFALQTHIRLDF